MCKYKTMHLWKKLAVNFMVILIFLRTASVQAVDENNSDTPITLKNLLRYILFFAIAIVFYFWKKLTPTTKSEIPKDIDKEINKYIFELMNLPSDSAKARELKAEIEKLQILKETQKNKL